MVTITMIVMFSIVLVVFLSLIMPMYSYALTLDKPVDCILGSECFIQNYVDLDPSDKALDYTCGPLSYDTHTGTDFRLKNLVQMREGVNVLAAADGTVKAIRDEMDDVSFRDVPAENIKDRNCGNAVILTHKGGYTTQYCHMMKGSVLVAVGDRVTHGTPLGKIGLSGLTEFPHLHLDVRNKDGETIDPFSGTVKNTTCGKASEDSNLWRVSVRKEMAYIPTGVLGYGFTQSPPSPDGARNGDFSDKDIPADAKTLIFWVDAFGLRNGDMISNELVDPENRVVVSQTQNIEGNKAQYFHFIGRHLREKFWMGGTYRATYRVYRQNGDKKEMVIEHQAELKIPFTDVPAEDFLDALGEPKSALPN